jgi:hypothetical protein
MSNQEINEKHKKTYQDLGLPGFRHTIVKLSKLLVQVWLNEGEGRQFKEDILSQGLEKALINQDLFLPTEWLTAELDVDTFIGSIEIDESDIWKNPEFGFKLLWKIPYAPWPQSGVTKEELEEWVKTCDKWLEEENHHKPEAHFPIPKNPYIPLATL